MIVVNLVNLIAYLAGQRVQAPTSLFLYRYGEKEAK